MTKKSLAEEYYERGYKEGYAEGFAGKPCSRSPRLMDFLNTREQQAYCDGLEDGYRDGQNNPYRKK